MRIIIAFTVLFLSYTVSGQGYQLVNEQTVKQEFEKIANKYQSTNFQLSFEKKIYRDSLDMNIMVQTKGKISRGVGYEYRMEESGMIVIQNNELKITIDSATQTVSIVKPDTLFKTVDIASFLNEKAFENYSFRRMENKGQLKYLIIPKNKIEGITELWINKEDYTLQRLNLSLPKANYFNESLEDETLESPLVVINYKPIVAMSKNAINQTFSMDEWLIKENDTYRLTSTKKMFELHDLRYKPQ